MTDWAADVEYISPSRRLVPTIWELMLQSLLRVEVLLQDEVLALSERLANWHRASSINARLLHEVLDIPGIMILRLPLTAYPDDLKAQALVSPICARQEYIRRTSKGARPFLPTLAQSEFASALDKTLSPEKLRETGKVPKVSAEPIFPLFAKTNWPKRWRAMRTRHGSARLSKTSHRNRRPRSCATRVTRRPP